MAVCIRMAAAKKRLADYRQGWSGSAVTVELAWLIERAEAAARAESLVAAWRSPALCDLPLDRVDAACELDAVLNAD